MVDPHRLDPPPAGFPRCGSCAYRRTGTPAICFACAAAENPLTPPRPACEVCGQTLGDDSRCPNTVCSLEDRWFSRIFTVTERSEEMWTAVCEYKYDEDRSWADILGRIFAGYLEDNREALEGYDLITTGALYVGPRANRLWDHLLPIMEGARSDGSSWPFTPDLIHKSAPSGQFLGRPVDATAESFERYRTRNDIPVVVDFWAPWCGPCRAMAPAYERAAAELEPGYRLLKVNAEEEPALASHYGIRSIPTMMMFRHGERVAQTAGAMNTAGIVDWVRKAGPARPS